jgi:hypothetical protein
MKDYPDGDGGGDLTFSEMTWVSDDNTIRVGALISTIATAVVLVVTNGFIAVFERIVAHQVGLIRGLGSFVAELTAVLLGETAGLVTYSWFVAFSEAVQYGPLAPLLLAAEAVLVLLIVALIRDRSPVP